MNRAIPLTTGSYIETTPKATIVITTKNRVADLVVAIKSVLEQSVECEVIVIDDGSTEATAVDIPANFPTIRYIRHEESAGYIVRRNEGADVASCEIIFSIDDDAAFQCRDTVAQTLAEFNDLRVGAVAIPFIDVRKGTAIQQLAPSSDGIFVTGAFIGTAHALRRTTFQQLGGYRSFFCHQGEEGDYCVRMLDKGYVVRLGRAEPILHFESPKRDFRRMDFYGRRNDILFYWFNAPFLALPFALAGTIVNGLRHGLRCKRFSVMAQGLVSGLFAIRLVLNKRAPVSRECFALFRQLKNLRCIEIEKVERFLKKA